MMENMWKIKIIKLTIFTAAVLGLGVFLNVGQTFAGNWFLKPSSWTTKITNESILDTYSCTRTPALYSELIDPTICPNRGPVDELAYSMTGGVSVYWGGGMAGEAYTNPSHENSGSAGIFYANAQSRVHPITVEIVTNSCDPLHGGYNCPGLQRPACNLGSHDSQKDAMMDHGWNIVPIPDGARPGGNWNMCTKLNYFDSPLIVIDNHDDVDPSNDELWELYEAGHCKSPGRVISLEASLSDAHDGYWTVMSVRKWERSGDGGTLWKPAWEAGIPPGQVQYGQYDYHGSGFTSSGSAMQSFITYDEIENDIPITHAIPLATCYKDIPESESRWLPYPLVSYGGTRGMLYFGQRFKLKQNFDCNQLEVGSRNFERRICEAAKTYGVFLQDWIGICNYGSVRKEDLFAVSDGRTYEGGKLSPEAILKGGIYSKADFIKNLVYVGPVFPSVNPADVNSDNHVNIKDIQICVKGIVDQNSIPGEQLAKCRAVALPDTVVNIKDIQEVIRKIINPS